MRDVTDEVRYGFSLYPFAAIIAVGVLLSSTGPTLLQTLLSTAGISSQAVMLTGILVAQLLGWIVAAAGLFGALKTVLDDTQ